MTDTPDSESADKFPSKLRSAVGLLGWLGLCFLAASLGSIFMPGEWYRGLEKPSWNPPSWLFAPVWTALYSMMAISAWRIWRRGGFSGQPMALSLFLCQLFLNAAWTPLFFGLHWMGIAFAEILILWLVLALTIFSFARGDCFAALMLVPYLVWISFASFLNFTLWKLNT